MSKIVVVGANHAGTAAVRTILNKNAGHEVVIYDRNSNISFLGCGMALWIGNQISKPDGLFYASKEEFESKGAKVYMETAVERVDFENKKIYAKTKDGEEIVDTYDKIILSTGSEPIIPNIPGHELENVMQVKLYQDAQAVIEKIKDKDVKNVTVVGAGYIGVELAEAFERHGKNTTLVDMADTVLSTYYDEEFTDLMKENLSKHNINLELGQSVQEIKGENGKVTSIVTNEKEIDTDLVVLCIGFKPNTVIGKDQLETFRNGAYLVNKKQETSIKDVYAIGDCATVYDNTIDAPNYIALASNAARSGIVGGSNATGVELESNGVQGSNGISIYGLNMVSTGITLKKAAALGIEVGHTDFEDTQKPGFIETTNPTVKIRIVYDKKTRVILGAQMASEYDMSMGIHLFSLAIQEKVTIDKLALTDLFFLPHFNQPYNYITMAAISAE
ncbi:H2O-forming NADH oxidase [uncultured Helcococcus sp.]|uniref:H2O-forming NADH oxidase n=1 Tax=uncultured Helcococcus sp. TaxID=1072508 RepID=UPI002629F779|nr:FAD-dependent oxidoreductase [uncultured Helcococcus sp.]